MRHLLPLLAVFLLLPAADAGAELVTFGADLTAPVNSTRTCQTGFFEPALIAANPAFPYTSYDSCTWWSVGGFSGTGGANVPRGGGTVRKVRVKVGAITGRMQVVALRLRREPHSLAAPGCCFYSSAGPVFTPAANGITELNVAMPVKNELDPASGIENYDVLALSVLDAGVPVPINATNDGGWGGLVAGMFPAYAPPEERTVGYGTVTPGSVLLQADLEPAAVTPMPTTPTPTTTVPVTGGVQNAPQVPLTVKLGLRPLRVQSGSLRVDVTCNQATPCNGTLRVQSRHAKVATAAGAHASRTLTYAAGRIGLASGAKKTIRARLSEAGRSALRRHKRLTAWVNVKVGSATVSSTRITIRR